MDAPELTGAQEPAASTPRPPVPAFHLTSVLNDPAESEWDFYSLLGALSGSDPQEVPPLAPGRLPEVTAADFTRYLRLLTTSWPAFVAAREAAREQQSATQVRAAFVATALSGQPQPADGGGSGQHLAQVRTSGAPAGRPGPAGGPVAQPLVG